MKRLSALLALPFAATAIIAAVPVPDSTPPIGRWANPRHTLEVETHACGPSTLCGAIVWADSTAQSDARDAGVQRLVGVQLLQGYRAAGGGEWSGRVYVPDMGRTFPSHIRLTTPDTLTIAGCLMGHLFCKSQTWRRVG
jgi:uncharacterized protein (DUF2147 family)